MQRRPGSYSSSRGIAAFVLCASLIRQFEFAQNVWINDKSFHELDSHSKNLRIDVRRAEARRELRDVADHVRPSGDVKRRVTPVDVGLAKRIGYASGEFALPRPALFAAEAPQTRRQFLRVCSASIASS